MVSFLFLMVITSSKEVMTYNSVTGAAHIGGQIHNILKEEDSSGQVM